MSNQGGGAFTFLDYDREPGSMGFSTGPITALTIAAALTQFGALRTAVQGITLGTLSDEILYVNRTRLSNETPTNELARRETKWLVTYEDDTQYFDPPTNAIPNAGYKKVFNSEIPTADIVGRLKPDMDEADLTDTDVAAFVTAFEALCKSPYGGAAHVLRITVVGRNN